MALIPNAKCHVFVKALESKPKVCTAQKKSNKNGVIFHIPLDKTVCLIVISKIVILFLCFDTLYALFGYFFPLYVDF